MKKREQIETLRAAIDAALVWFEAAAPEKWRSEEENAVIADMRNAMTLTFNPRHHQRVHA